MAATIIYVVRQKHGLQRHGGARRAAATMRGVASGVGSLGEFLTSVRDGNDQRVIDWLTHVRQENLSATDLTLEILKEVILGQEALMTNRSVMLARRLWHNSMNFIRTWTYLISRMRR